MAIASHRLSKEAKINTFILAIDQGTSSSRTILFDEQGTPHGLSQAEHRQIYPQPGWVEHDPSEIWETVQKLALATLDSAGVSKSNLAAIGITNQRETTVIWDKHTGQPIYNAIVWQDTRTDKIINELGRFGGQYRFQEKVGLPLATYFSGPKLRWILENLEGAREKAERGDLLFGTMDTWLIWNMTGGVKGGVHVTDVSNASRTLMMDLKTLDWDAEMLDQMSVPRSMLPAIRASSEVYGTCTIPGLEGIPVAGDLGDQQAALFGQTCYSPGEAKNTYGTGCFMLMNTGTQPILSQNGLLTTLAYKIGSQPAVYALEGSIAIAGALVQWLRDNLKIIETSADIEKLAATVEDSGGIYFVPAFSGLFAPYWQNDARGAIVGLTRYVTGGHLARATLEATAYQTAEVLEAMNKDSGVTLTALKVDGGMVFNDSLMQFQSDVLGVPVIRPKVAETTALGAAYAAGLAVGFWKQPQDLRANWQVDKTWEPRMAAPERAKLYKGWKKAVTRTFAWVEEERAD